MSAYYYPWFEPKLLSAVMVAELHDGEDPILVGRAGFNVGCRATILAYFGTRCELPIEKAQRRMRAGVMHEIKLQVFVEENESGEEVRTYPDTVQFGLWAPGSKNKAPDMHVRLPIEVQAPQVN